MFHDCFIVGIQQSCHCSVLYPDNIVETGVPTSVDFVQCEPTQMVVAYTSANAYVFDIEKSKPVIMLDYKPSLGIITAAMSVVYS